VQPEAVDEHRARVDQGDGDVVAAAQSVGRECSGVAADHDDLANWSRHGSFLSWLVLTATDKPPRRNARSTGRPDNSACCPVGLVRHQRPMEPTTMTNQPDRGLSAITGEWRQLINLV
jgi:hypothetical protein